MAQDPLSKAKNRAQQIPIDKKSKVGITLYDIDYAMMEMDVLMLKRQDLKILIKMES